MTLQPDPDIPGVRISEAKPLERGTLIEFHSGGDTYTGFVIGTCAYDNAGPDNAYVVRYAMRECDEEPRKPYTIVDMQLVSTIKKWPEDFTVGGHWSATPKDRCNEWNRIEKDGTIHIVPTV